MNYFVTLALIVVGAGLSPATTARCMISTPSEAFQKAKVIFVGKVISVEDPTLPAAPLQVEDVTLPAAPLQPRIYDLVRPIKSSYLAARLASLKTIKKQPQIMGFDYNIYLFSLRTYREKVLPAFRTYFAKNDPDSVIALIKECIRYLNDNPALSEELFWDEEICEEAIGILKGTVYYSPDGGRSNNQGNSEDAYKIRQEFARSNISAIVIEILCVPRYPDVNSMQNMGESPLISYLYEKSQYIEDLFTSVKQVRGGPIEFPIGESSELFTKQDTQELSMQVDKVPPPKASSMRKEYDNLRALLKLALDEGDLTLVLALM